MIVLDCSVTMAWCFEDEVSAYADDVLDSLMASEAYVPTIWSLEVANVLAIAERRKRITSMQSSSFIDTLYTLPIHIEHSTPARAQGSILELARTTGLTIYDAAYLELAVRHEAALATLDESVQAAAKELGLSLFQ